MNTKKTINNNVLNDVVKIERISANRVDVINAHLDCGWIIIGQDSEQYGCDSIRMNYHLGWLSSNGELKTITIDDYDVKRKPDYSKPDGWL